MSMRWLVFGHYGGHNTGDDAMLTGLLHGARRAGHRISCVVAKGVRPLPLVVGSGAMSVSARLLPVLRALWRVDGLVLGGGTHFHDEYYGMRYWRHLRYMLRIASLSWIARVAGRRVVWLGMGVGPLSRASSRLVTRFGLAACHAIGLRDSASFREVRSLGSSSKATVTFDLAALMSPHPSEIGVPPEQRTPCLGICATRVDWMRKDEDWNGAFWSRVSDSVRAVLQQRRTLRVAVFVIRGGEREADCSISRLIYDRLREVAEDRVVLVPYHDEPSEALAALQRCTAVVAARFHGALLAYLAGCALVLVAYHRKVRDLAAELGLTAEGVISGSEEIDVNVMSARVNQALDRSPGFLPTLSIGEALRRAEGNLALLAMKPRRQ